jgi:hypothetical protein
MGAGFLEGGLLSGEVLELVDEVAGVTLTANLAVLEGGPEVGVACVRVESRW